MVLDYTDVASYYSYMSNAQTTMTMQKFNEGGKVSIRLRINNADSQLAETLKSLGYKQQGLSDYYADAFDAAGLDAIRNPIMGQFETKNGVCAKKAVA